MKNATYLLNEGSALNLPQLFEETTARVGLLDSVWLDTERWAGTEDAYVGGLLRCLAQSRRSRYLTGNVDVVKVATCLRQIGRPVGPIRIWTSEDRPPRAYEGLKLVANSSYITGSLTLLDDEVPHSLKMRYSTYMITEMKRLD